MESIVLYPSPAIGHLIAMVELGKLILTSKPSLSVHILVTTPPYKAGDTASYIAGVSATISSITFHHLPPISLPPELFTASAYHENLMFEVLRLNKRIVAEALRSISQNHIVHAFIMDFFCASTLSVISYDNQLNKIPSYIFFTSSASSLAKALYLPTLDKTIPNILNLDIDNTLLDIPGCPPIPLSDMPKSFQDRRDNTYRYFVESSTFYPKADGIIVNTFESLESRALKAISDGLCVPDAPTPPVYCIGPLITAKEKKYSQIECLKWLDSQPRESVVFLCFGSLGLFSKEQLKEIAVGLERSGQRFLWVVRNPPSYKRSENVAISVLPDPDLDSLLPEGFLDRTKDRGLVVKNWVPQVEVLGHDSVGGFVTHCGWNSVLESVYASVPMVAWPLYAEQRFNKVVLVEEIKIALPMMESDRDGFVSAGEVKRRVTELMAGSESGNSVRKRVLGMKDEARAAVSAGGSSQVALKKLTELWKKLLLTC